MFLKQSVIMDELKYRMDGKRLNHVLGVKEEALKLAEIYHYLDKEEVIFSALLHDICKNFDNASINEYVKKYNLGHIYINNNALAHSKIGAIVAKEEFGINNKRILDAIAFHTTGRENMSLLEKIIYLSDATEKNRVFDGVESIRSLSYKDLDRACLKSIDRSIINILSRGEYLDMDTMRARNSLLIKIGGKNDE